LLAAPLTGASAACACSAAVWVCPVRFPDLRMPHPGRPRPSSGCPCSCSTVSAFSPVCRQPSSSGVPGCLPGLWSRPTSGSASSDQRNTRRTGTDAELRRCGQRNHRHSSGSSDATDARHPFSASRTWTSLLPYPDPFRLVTLLPLLWRVSPRAVSAPGRTGWPSRNASASACASHLGNHLPQAYPEPSESPLMIHSGFRNCFRSCSGNCPPHRVQ
jgi:hypothetical protein